LLLLLLLLFDTIFFWGFPCIAVFSCIGFAKTVNARCINQLTLVHPVYALMILINFSLWPLISIFSIITCDDNVRHYSKLVHYALLQTVYSWRKCAYEWNWLDNENNLWVIVVSPKIELKLKASTDRQTLFNKILSRILLSRDFSDELFCKFFLGKVDDNRPFCMHMLAWIDAQCAVDEARRNSWQRHIFLLSVVDK